jgi:hypothetical protein
MKMDSKQPFDLIVLKILKVTRGIINKYAKGTTKEFNFSNKEFSQHELFKSWQL